MGKIGGQGSSLNKAFSLIDKPFFTGPGPQFVSKDRENSLSQPGWQTLIETGLFLSKVGFVAGKEFITAIAT